MSRKFLTAIDLSKNELQNAAVQNLPSAPATPVKGQLYFNSTGGDNTLYWYDGTTWVPAKDTGSGFGAVVAETTFGGAAADGVATTVARSDHKHANPVHDNAAHSAITLNSLAAPTADRTMGGFKITGLGDPVLGTDAANKNYVDNAVAGLSWKEAVRVSSTAQVALTGLVAIDGVTPVANDRILLKNQTAPAENGIWIAAVGAWSRSNDNNSSSEMSGAAVYVEEGTTQADTAWVVTTNDPITIGTTAIAWTQFAGGGTLNAGAGMTQTGNAFNVIAGDATLVVTADAIVRAALTGDVTTVLNASTIANGVVTNAKLATMPTLTFKGNNTGVTAAPLDLTVAQMQTALDISTTAGAAATYTKTLAVNCLAALNTTVTHNFNTRDVIVNVYRTTTPWDQVETDVELTTVNSLDIRFAVAPTAGQYRIVVQGVDQ